MRERIDACGVEEGERGEEELHLTLQLHKKFLYKDSYWFKGVGGGGDLIAGSIHAGARKICKRRRKWSWNLEPSYSL